MIKKSGHQITKRNVQMNIVFYPHRALRTKCKRVKKIDTSVITQARQLQETLKHISRNPIRALAANQLGFNKRIIVVKLFGDKYFTMINPQIVKSYIPCVFPSRCLSLPMAGIKIKRCRLIVLVKYTTLAKNRNSKIFNGPRAVLMQHEINHLNGKLIID